MGFNFEFSLTNGKGAIPRRTEGYINYKVVIMETTDAEDSEKTIRKYIELDTHRCNEADLKSRTGLEETYASNQFGLMNCVDDLSSISIWGGLGEKSSSQYIKVSIERCKGKENDCKSEEEIDKFVG